MIFFSVTADANNAVMLWAFALPSLNVSSGIPDSPNRDCSCCPVLLHYFKILSLSAQRHSQAFLSALSLLSRQTNISFLFLLLSIQSNYELFGSHFLFVKSQRNLKRREGNCFLNPWFLRTGKHSLPRGRKKYSWFLVSKFW